jgi:hypothetical protein
VAQVVRTIVAPAAWVSPRISLAPAWLIDGIEAGDRRQHDLEVGRKLDPSEPFSAIGASPVALMRDHHEIDEWETSASRWSTPATLMRLR